MQHPDKYCNVSSIYLSWGGCQRESAICVDFVRFCHRLIAEGKCHHERDGDIEQRGAEKVNGVKSKPPKRPSWMEHYPKEGMPLQADTIATISSRAEVLMQAPQGL